MENINYDQENNLLGDYFFKISYPKQNYKELKEYQNWKKSVTDRIGKNGKEIICYEDNTIIYIIHNNNDEIIKCPTCNTDLYNCIYCNITQTEKCHICCLRAYLKYIFKANYKTCVHNLNQDQGNYFNELLITLSHILTFLHICKIVQKINELAFVEEILSFTKIRGILTVPQIHY